MRTIAMICLALAGLSLNTFAQSRKVLLIGNSYTAYNNLYQMLEQLAASKGDSLQVYAVSPGGYTFELHSTYQPTLAMIDSMPWDFVVLQEQSQRPAFPQRQVQVEVYPYARALDSLILLNNPCTETVFYMTWGRKYGDTQNCSIWPPVCTFTGMQQQLRDSYVKMANDNQALVAPAGEAWERSWVADSSINLWISDNSHPSLAGSYLTACVLYSTILRKPASGATWNGGLSSAQATFLQGIADSTVFDSLSTWNIGEYDPQSLFSYLANGLNVQFSNLSINSSSFSWDFGDGDTSQLADPAHSYNAPGIYTVSLISNNGCSADTFSLNISISATGLGVAEAGTSCSLNFYGSLLSWNCEKIESIRIYSSNGQLIRNLNTNTEEGSINLYGLQQGIYTAVAFSSKGRAGTCRFRQVE